MGNIISAFFPLGKLEWIYLIQKGSFWTVRDSTSMGSWKWRKLLKYQELAKSLSKWRWIIVQKPPFGMIIGPTWEGHGKEDSYILVFKGFI